MCHGKGELPGREDLNICLSQWRTREQSSGNHPRRNELVTMVGTAAPLAFFRFSAMKLRHVRSRHARRAVSFVSVCASRKLWNPQARKTRPQWVVLRAHRLCNSYRV
jgi:hypothetical protein